LASELLWMWRQSRVCATANMGGSGCPVLRLVTVPLELIGQYAPSICSNNLVKFLT